ncbi:MAG: DUF2520 domain-containing protein [Ignavibacteriales bacterium]|nr:DUF2520 domain-containing protein [Ignavibacteriales bacterium]
MEFRAAFIGTGRVAWTLGDAFVDVGYFIHFASNRTEEPLKKFAEEFMVDEISTNIKDISKFASKFQVCIIAVPDSAIKEVADTLAGLPLNFKTTLFMHLSGSKTSAELASLKKMGAMTGSFHIPQSFPSRKAIRLWDLPVCIEASSVKAEKMMLQFAKRLKLKPICIKPELKIYYHLAAVFASNFFPVIIADSMKMFEKAGGKEKDYFKIFTPIIATTIQNIIENGPENSVSGVISRKDFGTLQEHLNALSYDGSSQEQLLTYIRLSEETAKMLGINLKIVPNKTEEEGK